MKLKQLLYPPRCPFCGRLQREEKPCADCRRHTEELTAVVCYTCGAPPAYCKCGSRIFSFARNTSAFAYNGAPRNLLLRFKQRGKPQLSDFMGNRMYYHVHARFGDEFSCVTYVPQSLKSDLQRGYCPAQLLAEVLAERLKVPCLNVLQRKGSKQQKYTQTASRWENAKHNFSLRKRASLSGRVLLIDDLFTSGATLNACAALLKNAGASEVYTATFAIAVKKS